MGSIVYVAELEEGPCLSWFVHHKMGILLLSCIGAGALLDPKDKEKV